jgi:hypothetical protein
MTQEIMNKIFEGELGSQCNSLFSTPDDNVFIRYSEAVSHCMGAALNKDEIIEWFEEYSGGDINPIVRIADFDNEGSN